mgnify:CR=1 FL=1
MDIFVIFEKGGVIMYPILLCSVISITILFERMFSLRRSKIASNPELIIHLSEKGSWDEIATEVKKKDDLFSKILDLVIADNTGQDPESYRNVCKES